MVEASLLMIYTGGFCLLLAVSEMLFMLLCFIIYKKDKGKLSFWQYVKRWNA